MLKSFIYGLVMSISIGFSGISLADELPTIHQVYEKVQSGHLDEAQGMIQQVLQAHPNSAKAHYVEAEILAKQGQSTKAREEFNTAERLEPGLPFAKPQAVQALKSSISHQPQAVSLGTTSTPAAAGFPWGMLLLGIGSIVVITLIIRAMTKRNSVPVMGNYPANYQPGMPGGQPYAGGGAVANTGMGSGIMSGLATGAAVGVGMVAGEALAHHFMDGDRASQNTSTPVADSWGTSSDDMGGSDFGIADNSSWDDNSSMADISGGGDDWT